MKKRIIYLLAAMLLMLPAMAGCDKKEVLLEDLFPQNLITRTQIAYMDKSNNASRTVESSDADFAQLISAIYSAPAAKAQEGSYSPELRASHRITLYGAHPVVVYYDAADKRLSVPSYRDSQEENKVRTYLMYEVDIAAILDHLEADAVVPVEPTDEPPVPMDDLLRAEIVAEDLEQEGEPLEYEVFNYPVKLEEPLYTVQTHLDDIPGLENGYVLVVAAWGKKPTEGYIIDFVSIEENDAYYKVIVHQDTELEAAQTESWPAAAALIDARRMSADKPVVFLMENMDLITAMKIDRSFFDQLPTDMPPLATPEPYDDTDGRTE